MRILGYINHDQIKITVFEDNNKIIAQCEDGLCQLTYKFRTGGPIENLASIQAIFNQSFLKDIGEQLAAMEAKRQSGIIRLSELQDEDFPMII